MYAPYAEIVHGPDGLQFVFSPGFTAGDLALRQQLTVLQARHPRPRLAIEPSLLGDAAAVLVEVEAHACHRPTGDSRSLASSRFQIVLDVALAA
jgi:hypothetical protein